MKRTLMLATGMAVLSTAIYLGSTLFAQGPATAPAQQPAAATPPQTRIALINLNYVVKNYQKFLAFQGEMKGILEQYQVNDKTIASQIELKMKEKDKPGLTAPQKAAIDEELKNLGRKREDNTTAGKKALAEKSDVGMVQLYQEVAGAAERYAKARGIELVLHYNDALDATEYWSAPNVARKLQAGACIPLYYQAGMDISPQVVQMLNQSYQPRAAAPAGQPAQSGQPVMAQPPQK